MHRRQTPGATGLGSRDSWTLCGWADKWVKLASTENDETEEELVVIDEEMYKRRCLSSVEADAEYCRNLHHEQAVLPSQPRSSSWLSTSCLVRRQQQQAYASTLNAQSNGDLSSASTHWEQEP